MSRANLSTEHMFSPLPHLFFTASKWTNQYLQVKTIPFQMAIYASFLFVSDGKKIPNFIFSTRFFFIRIFLLNKDEAARTNYGESVVVSPACRFRLHIFSTSICLSFATRENNASIAFVSAHAAQIDDDSRSNGDRQKKTRRDHANTSKRSKYHTALCRIATAEVFDGSRAAKDLTEQ